MNRRTYHAGLCVQLLPVCGIICCDSYDGHTSVALKNGVLVRVADVLSSEDTAQDGHVDIEKNTVELAMLEKLEGERSRLDGVDGLDEVDHVTVEGSGQDVEVDWVVVDDEDAQAFACNAGIK